MEASLHVLLLVTLAFAAIVHPGSSSCPRGCRLPDCRCWNHPSRPGNFTNDGTPQIIALTFSQAMNNHTLSKYMPLFEGLVNPNNCSAKGTFFAQYDNTDEDSLRMLSTSGHEVALTSADGSIPKDRREWVESLFKSSEKLYDAGIARDKIKGARAPNLYMGGNDELQAEMQFGMDYEASCVMRLPSKDGSSKQMMWPFTYDYVENIPHCSMGKVPDQRFPGLWQFMVPEMTLGSHTCSTLSSCSPYINTTADAFTLLYNTFQSHYYMGRAPMTLYIDATWLTKDVQVKGLLEFLQVVSRFRDTWMVTLSQALEWVRFPVPMYKTVRFLPWECTPQEKAANGMYNNRR